MKEKPAFVSPMLCEGCRELPDGPGWLYEVKFDGYRGVAIKDGAKVTLLSRNGKELAFPQVVKAVAALPAKQVVLDGEIVALEDSGRPSFQALQNLGSVGKGCHICYYAFDLLHLEGSRLRNLPLHERKAFLAGVIADSAVRCSGCFETEPSVLLEEVKKHQLEGIVAKLKNSKYEPGKRSGAWRKYKVHQQDDFIIGGFAPGSPFDSILVGYLDGERLMFAAEVQAGFNHFSRQLLGELLPQLKQSECPFANLPDRRPNRFGQGITAKDMRLYRWVTPTLTARIGYLEWTRGERLREARFVGLIAKGANG